MHQDKIPIIILLGPTAIGKTDIGINIAQDLNTEIISADSMQIYRYLDIGTAKPTPKQQQLVKHYLIDVINPDEPYNAAMYSRHAEQVAVDLVQQHKIPLVVGGSGLYIRALIDGIFDQPKIDADWRDKFKKDNETRTSPELYAELQKKDAVAALKIHQNDRRRILRALEVYYFFQVPISQLQHQQQEQGSRFQPIYFGLKMEMKELYYRIDRRVDQMLEQGWIDEVKQLRGKGYSPKVLSMQGLGYRHLNSFLDNKLSHEQMIHVIKRDTRHYAKRQMTWFRANQRLVWFEVTETNRSEIISKILHYLEKNTKKT
ncbi:MAG: tRNA (adenosine(37)-N6)-dimethylallyltransferase MiaA [bacterium]